MTEITQEQIDAGISLYSRYLLSIYNWLLLGLGCRFLWKCPSRHMLDLYNRFVSSNHLDIGVGTGYFMDKCQFPTDTPRIALMDLNTNSLNTAGKRLSRYHPEVYRRNALERFNLNAPPFDSIGMMNLLHCLPGNMKTKGVVFQYASEILNAGGVIFGSSILYQGVKRNHVINFMTLLINRAGIITNLEDTAEDLKESLDRYFTGSSVYIIGREVLFHARK